MNKKRKILSIIQTPPPVHGSAIMNNYIFKSNLLKEAFEMDFVHYNFVKKISEIGGFNFRKIIKFLRYFIIVFYKLLFERPDLVYFPIVPYGSSFYRDSVLVLLIKLFKIPLVYHLHGKGAVKHYSKSKKIYDFVYNDVNVICLSENLIHDIEFFKGSINIVPNGIEVKVFEPKKEFNSIPNILYLSNFIKEKGVLQLLKAVVLIKNKGISHFKVNLVGAYTDEINEKLIQEFIDKNNLHKEVNVHGPLYNSDKEKVLKDSDIFCFPTYYKNETFGLVNLEAMQYSLPIISSFEGAIPDLINDNYNGFLVDPIDIEALSNKLIELITNSDLRKSMGINSYNLFKKKYTKEKFENNMIRTFKKILLCVE